MGDGTLSRQLDADELERLLRWTQSDRDMWQRLATTMLVGMALEAVLFMWALNWVCR